MTRAKLHQLVDALPEESLEAVAVLLRRAQDPVLAQLDAAPYDDERVSDKDREAVDGARPQSAPVGRRRRGSGF